MTRQEFTKALTHLGLTQRDFAAIVEVDERTVGRWVSGRTKVPTAIAKLLKLMLAHQELKPKRPKNKE